MNLWGLPEEILLNILSHLNGPELLTFASVNKYTNAFYKSSSRLQYIAELDLAGCLDESLDAQGGNNTSLRESDGVEAADSGRAPNSSEKLAYLRTRERNWRTLDLTRNAKKIPLERAMEVSVYDLSGGVFGFAEFGRENLLRYVELREVSRREGVEDDGSGVTPGQLESDNDAISTSTGDTAESDAEAPKLPKTDVPWKTFPFEGNVADFGLALKEHDLIISVSYDAKDWEGRLRLPSMQVIKLRLYQFSSQSPHPSAKEPCILLSEKPTVFARPSPIMEVSGNYIVILLTFPRAMIRESVVEDLFVINWQTGRIICHQSFDVSTYTSVAFVTPSLLVLPNLVENALDLLHICTAFENVHPDGNAVERTVLLRRLRLPEMTSTFKLRGAVCRGDPNPTSSTFDPLADYHGTGTGVQTMSQPGGSSMVARKWGAAGCGVTSNPLRAIVSFKFIIVHADAAIPYGPALNLVVHRSSLASLAQPAFERHQELFLPSKLTAASTATASTTGVNELQWKEWGPKVSRWRLEDDYVEWVTTTAGQRQVFTSLAPDSDVRWWRSVVVVRDFNPFEVKRMRARAMCQRAGKRAGRIQVEGKGKGKGKAVEDDWNRSKEDDEIKIHVDSIDGEREDDSEDEDELGLGVSEDTTLGMTQAATPVPGSLPVIWENGAHHVPEIAFGDDVIGDNRVANRHAVGDMDGPQPGSSPTMSSLAPPISSTGSGSNLSSPGILPPPTASTSLGAQASPSSSSTASLPDHSNDSSEQHEPDAVSSSAHSVFSPLINSHPQPIPASSNAPLKLISIRIRDTLSTTKVRYYRSGDLSGGLPCVEYVLEGCEALFSGVLMDEERIIGYLEDAENPEQIERMSQMCVFSMYP